MNYLQKKKLAFMSIANRIKGFVRTVMGVPPLSLPDCVDTDSLIDYSISGNSVQNGTPTPENPVEVESVGERTKNLVKVVDTTYSNVATAKGGEIIVSEQWSMDEYYYIPMISDILTIGNTYTLSFGGNVISTKGSSNVEITFEDGTTKQLWGNWRKLSFTAVSPIKKIQFVLSNTDTGIYRNTPIKIMLEEGSGVTDYEPYGYKIPVVCSGKNVVGGYSYIDQTTRYYSVITVSQPYTLKQGVTYTISFDTPNTNKAVCFSNYQYTEQGLQNVTLNGTRRSVTITPTRDLSVSALISVTSVVGEGNSAGLCSNCMIEIGATATDYELYIEPVATNIYLDEPLAEGETLTNPVKLPTFKGATVYTIDTTVQPSEMSATYYATSKE